MSRLFLAALTAVILWLPCLSQSQDKPPTKSKSSPKQHSRLVVVETIKILSEQAQSIDTEDPSRCDVDGNFYLRVQEHVEPSIRRINAEGIQEVLFGLPQFPT
jgi:hypothetical protein